ncbi:MFS transporter [Aspergillus niger]|uniref:MFS transporter n=1 Tax=Aspergillus niger TaxID=5061 RepID=A0A100I5L5_ASPNG|nr:MFS transporter [Aspergillus niger]
MPLESNEPLDREDAPFLASGQRPSSPVEEESGPSDAEKEHLRKTRLRLMLTLFAMILAVEVGICMSNGPVTRIYESIACREYYAQYDPTKIGADGEVQEELCKVKAVQQDLAAVKGYMEFFDGILSAVLAIPYGLLADRRGRKSTICLSIPGFALNCIIQLVVMWRPDVFPLRTVWASSLAWLFGGGPVVAFAIIWTMMSDVSTEEERAAIFFRFGVASMGADFASSAASSWLMALDPWLPLLLGWGLAVVGMFFALSLPETMRVGSSQPTWKQPSMEMSQVSPGNAEYKEVPSKEQEHEVLSDEETLQGEEASFTTKAARPTFFASAKQRSRAYFAPYSFIFRNKQIMLLLTAFLVYRLSRGSSWFLVQYISTRYKWTLAEANFLMSFKPALTIPLFLFILPAISRQLLKTMKPTQKDLQLMRISIGLLAVGTLGIGLSPSVAMLIPSLLVQTSGSGFVFLTRALITTLVNREETARLFTIIEVLQSVGNVIASLSITTVFQIGLELGGAWIGLAWMMTATAFTLVGVAIWMFRIPSRQSDDKIEEENVVF